MKKIVKICLISFVLVGVFAVVFCGTYLSVNYIKFQSLPLNVEALENSALSIKVYDIENRQLEEENEYSATVALADLPQHTKDAFISIEDKEFYNHNGLNYKRMASAMLKNIRSLSLKEGASTISQQLIKNTHLSGEKTFKRKLKEVALTKKLEAVFDKDEILESYLNIIFFGNNCYGIESATNYYFNKSASDLNLNESCTLAAIIKSPTKYSPISNYDNALTRRNLVLSEMQKDGKITVDEKIQTENQPITLQIRKNTSERLNSYSQSAIDEAAKLLHMTPKEVAIGGYKIHTYQNSQKQQELTSALDSNKLEDVDNAGIVIDAKTFGISAYSGNSNFKILDCRRQPASCIKPLLVYAPALNEGVVSPDTQILDEKITIGGYSPSNVNKNYGGHMSVTNAVKNSVNIPAIKVLSYIGIDTGKQYAEKLGITFDEKDDSYAIALGGMTYGVSLKDLASAYTVFPNGGEYADATFVQYITDSNNQLVYVHKPATRMVFREDSAYLMTSILQETAKSGTSRKLSTISNTEIAAKTGTVGNSNGNTDAYNIAYTPEEVIGVWYGNLHNKPVQVAGGNQPTEVVHTYVNTQTYDKTKFSVPSSVVEAKVDTLELEENHRLVLASPYAPERYTKTCLFSRFNMPSTTSQNFTQEPEINADAYVENGQIMLKISAQKHLEYQIFKDDIPHQTIRNKSGDLTLRLNFPESESSIKITATYADNPANSNMTATKTFNLKHPTNSTPTKKKKWYI